MTHFLLDYIMKNKQSWKAQPKLYSGEGFQNCIVMVFGKPRTAIYAHMDSIGFTVRYSNQLVRIGGPHAVSGCMLVGTDSKGPLECELEIDDENHFYFKCDRQIDRGTDLTYKPNWREDE